MKPKLEFNDKVILQQDKVKKIKDKLKIEQDKLYKLYEMCSHNVGTYFHEVYYEPVGHEQGYSVRSEYCCLCNTCIKQTDNYGGSFK